MRSIFEFSEYKQYIKSALDHFEPKRGVRGRLAKHLNCQSSFVSKVLNGEGHFTQEQLILVGTFLELSSVETDFLLTLHLWERSGSPKLQQFYQDKIKDLRKRKWNISDRAVQGGSIDQEIAQIYYSNWYYAAVYTAAGIDGLHSVEDIATKLSLSKNTVHNAIDFLLKNGILVKSNEGLKIGPRRLHLPRESNLTVQNHINWRIKAIQQLQQEGVADNIHYSAILGLSKEGIEPMRELLMRTIKESELIVNIEGAHQLCLFNLDFVIM